MATSQQKMFNPPSPPDKGGIVLPLTRGIEGVAFHVLAQEKKSTETLHEQLFVLARFAFADVKLFAHAICGLVSRYSL